MNAYIQIAKILQRAIAPLHTNTKTTTPAQTTGIKQQHLTQEPRVIDTTLTTAPTTRQEPRVMTTDVLETIQDTEKIDNAPHAPNATSATASNTSPIVSPNTQPASGHTTDNVFEAAAEATSGASSKQHQTRTATFHNVNSIINQHKHQQTTTTPPPQRACGHLNKPPPEPRKTHLETQPRVRVHTLTAAHNINIKQHRWNGHNCTNPQAFHPARQKNHVCQLHL